MLKEIEKYQLQDPIEIQQKSILEQAKIYAPIILALCNFALLIPFLGRKTKDKIRQLKTWLEFIVILP